MLQNTIKHGYISIGFTHHNCNQKNKHCECLNYCGVQNNDVPLDNANNKKLKNKHSESLH